MYFTFILILKRLHKRFLTDSLKMKKKNVKKFIITYYLTNLSYLQIIIIYIVANVICILVQHMKVYYFQINFYINLIFYINFDKLPNDSKLNQTFTEKCWTFIHTVHLPSFFYSEFLFFILSSIISGQILIFFVNIFSL